MPTQSLLTPEVTQLIGGLDFVSPRPSVSPGALLDCYNYEVTDIIGYKRIDGIEAFDGGPSQSITTTALYSVSLNTNSTSSFSAGMLMWPSTEDRTTCFGQVTSVELVGSTVVLNFIVFNSSIFYRIFGTGASNIGVAFDSNTNVFTTSSEPMDYFQAHAEGGLITVPTVSNITDSLSIIKNEYKNLEGTKSSGSTSLIEGNILSFNPSIGLHWFNDQLYTINDLPSFTFTSGNVQLYPGDLLSTNTPPLPPYITVKDVVLTSGSWSSGTASGKILYDISSTIPDNLYNALAITNNHNIIHTAFNNATLNGLTLNLYRGATRTDSVVTCSTGIGGTIPKTWLAGMYRSYGAAQLGVDDGIKDYTSQGFKCIDLGYNFQFKDGTTNGPPAVANRDANPQTALVQSINCYPSSASCAPGFFSNNFNTHADWAYTITGATGNSAALQTLLVLNDGKYLQPNPNTSTGHPLLLSGFSFSGIPSDAIITGFAVTVNHFCNATATTNDIKFEVSASVDGTTYGTSKQTRSPLTYAASTSSSATDQDILGNSGDSWGLSSLSPANINNLTVQIKHAGVYNGAIYLDSIFVTVYYQKTSSIYYFYNGTDDVQATITNVYVDPINGGSWAGADATGTMQVANVSPLFLDAPVLASLTTSSTGGSLPDNTTYYYVVTALGAVGETLASNEFSITTGTGTSTNSNTITWGQVTGNAGYNIAVGTASGAENTVYTVTTDTTTYTDTGATGSAWANPSYNTATNSNRNTILSGDKIYSGPGATGLLIGTVTTNMAYSGLPSFSQIQATISQYEIIDANFYGNDSWNTIYGVSGAGKAWAYDGYYFRYIFTGLAEQLDKPRHVAFNNFHLCLGYNSGSVLTSVSGDPENFNGILGAGEFDTGDSVTGFLAITGSAFAVFCKKSIHLLYGTDNTNFSLSTFNAHEGAIEYTVANCGKPVWCSNRGISTLEQSNAYGNFLGSRFSTNITPWLLPRINNVARYITDNNIALLDSTSRLSRGILFALPVRGKNQYKIAFEDGFWLTMTLQGSNLTPIFTLQELYTTRYNGTAPYTNNFIPLAHSHGIDTNGNDRIHLSCYDPIKGLQGTNIINQDSQYIWELDRGWSFGGDTPIKAWFTTTSNFFDNPFQLMTVRDVRAHGTSFGVATVTLATSADYLYNDFTFGNIFGETATNTSPQDISLPRDGGSNSYNQRAPDPIPQTNIAACGKSGRSFAFQFATNPTIPEPPHIYQQLMFQLSTGKADIK